MEHEDIIQATCPECRGPLRKVALDHIHEYECLVGHKYSARVLLEAHSETQERALWAAIVALDEGRNLVRAVREDLPSEVVRGLEAQAETKHEQAAVIRRLVEQLEPFHV